MGDRPDPTLLDRLRRLLHRDYLRELVVEEMPMLMIAIAWVRVEPEDPVSIPWDHFAWHRFSCVGERIASVLPRPEGHSYDTMVNGEPGPTFPTVQKAQSWCDARLREAGWLWVRSSKGQGLA